GVDTPGTRTSGGAPASSPCARLLARAMVAFSLIERPILVVEKTLSGESKMAGKMGQDFERFLEGRSNCSGSHAGLAVWSVAEVVRLREALPKSRDFGYTR